MPDDGDDGPDLDDYINLSPYFERDTHRAARIQYYVFTALTLGLLLATIGFSTATATNAIAVDGSGAIVTALIIALACSTIGFNGAFDERNRWRYMTPDNSSIEDDITTTEESSENGETHPNQQTKDE